MAKAKKKVSKKGAVEKEAAAALGRFERSLVYEQSERNDAIVEEALKLRNADHNMTFALIATHLGTDRTFLQRNIGRLQEYFRAREMGEILLACLSVNMSLSEYFLYLHSQHGVPYVRKNGNPELVQKMFQVAAGEPV